LIGRTLNPHQQYARGQPAATRKQRQTMNKWSAGISLIVIAAAPALALAQQPQPPPGWAEQHQLTPAQQQQAQNWADQQARNAAMTQAALARQAQQPVRPQVLQYQRWQNEWKQQHPGEPMPSLGVLEHMHEKELVANTHVDGQRMWAARQAELKANYQKARQMQEQKNAARHVTWNSQQWANWDKAYDQQMHQQAIDYEHAREQAGEELRAEMAEQARREGRAF
jgi:hypothetical protein